MQVREFSSSLSADSPPLFGVLIKNRTEPRKGDGFDTMTVAAHYCRCHGQRVENGFFRGFDCRRDQWIQVCVGEVGLLKRRLLGIVGNDIRRGECQHEVAAAMARGGTGTCESQRGTFRQSRELAAIKRSVSGDNHYNGSFALA